MPTALETFRQWEISPPATVCHMVIIHAGDGSDAQRITVTDRPYYDFGSGGIKYHHKFLPPVHCIISHIITTDAKDGASIGEIELTNEAGLFDSAALDAIVTKRFEIHRGDTRWSLME